VCRSSTCLTVGSTCSAMMWAHGMPALEVLSHGGAASGRGARQPEANERGGSESAQMGYSFGRGGIRAMANVGAR
jgi:hypothetical protein